MCRLGRSGCKAKTFNTRLTALGSACMYWRDQEWLAGDPLVRLRARPAPPDNSKALTRVQVAMVLALDVPLRERVLWTLLYKSTARSEEVLLLDVPHLESSSRRTVVTPQGRRLGRDRLADRHRPAAARPQDRTGVPHRPQGQALGRGG